MTKTLPVPLKTKIYVSVLKEGKKKKLLVVLFDWVGRQRAEARLL